MGLDPVSWIALAGLAASAAGTGYQAKRGHDQAVEAKHVQTAQEQAVRDQTAKLSSDQASADATQAARMARMRQKAIAGGVSQTIATSPLGLAAPSGAPAGPAPLKTLGA